MDEAQLKQADWEGAKVQGWADDPLFQRINRELEAAIIAEMCDTPTHDVDLLRDRRLMLAAHRRWKAVLAEYMQNGAVARERLKPPLAKKPRFVDRFNFDGKYNPPE